VNKGRIGAAVVLCGVLAVPAGATGVRGGGPPEEKGHINELAPTGKGWGENHAQGQAKPGGGGGGSNGIFYHGGPVMLGTVNVHYIWYGNWNSASPEVDILEDFANGIGGSPYYNINTTYYNGSNQHVANSIAFQGSHMVTNYLGNALTDAQIRQIVSDAGADDPNAVYFVITDKTVNATSGFCTQYCGWHTHATIGGQDIKYSFIGDSSRCASSCQAQAVGPNGSSGADGMASILAHELEEATSDPDLNAWYDRRGYENADKCAWTFGTQSTASNGAKYNMSFAGRNWLIQQNWVNASGGYCAVKYP
jgi:phosphate-induced protein 1